MLIVYVGITTDTHGRFRKHYINADNADLKTFMDTLKNDGLIPVFEIIDKGILMELHQLEREYISKYLSEGHPILN